MASTKLLTGLAVLFAIILTVSGDHYYVVESNGSPCPPCGHNEHPVNLSTVIGQPSIYLTSGTILTFLPGTHILDYSGPIVISDVSNLTLQGNGSIEDGFHWTVKQSDVVIKCRDSVGGGFVFHKSNVTIKKVTFTDCGTSHYNGFLDEVRKHYTNGLYLNSFNAAMYSEVGATLLFIECQEVYLGSYLSVQNCSGNCLTFFNSYNVNISHVYLAHNIPEQYDAMECCNATPTTKPGCVGGNAFFYYLDSPHCNDSAGTNFTLNIFNSSFSFGAGPGANETATLSGLTIFNLRVAMLYVQIESLLLFDNAGGNFGVISTYSDFKLNEVQSMYANRYLVNCCPKVMVGIAFKFSISNEVTCQPLKRGHEAYTEANVTISHSVFEENYAVDSAGININSRLVADFLHTRADLNFIVEKSRIQRNHAPQASCIGSGGLIGYPAVLTIRLTDVAMTNNYFYQPLISTYLGIPPSCFVLLTISYVQFNNVTIANQPLLGVFGVASQLSFFGDNLIQNNTGGEKGGAIALDNCKFILHNSSTVQLIDNHAKRGAGIYIFQPRVLPLMNSLCLFQVASDSSNSSSIYFSGNKANITGDAVYGGNLDLCYLFNDDKIIGHLSHFMHNLFFVADNNQSRAHYTFSSNPDRLCFCNNTTNQLNCDERIRHEGAMFPGQVMEFKVAAVGQFEGFSTGTVFILANFSNGMVQILQNNISKPNCTRMSVQLAYSGSINSSSVATKTVLPDNTTVSFIVELNPSRILQIPKSVKIFVPVKDCPPGFSLDGSSFTCQCAPLFDRMDIACGIGNSTMTTHSSDIWIGYRGNRTIIGYHCPYDYCISEPVTFNILKPDAQCAYNRSGILCGGCAEGYSLLLGSNECGECPNNNYLSLLLVFGVAGILLVVLLILLNLTVSVGTINGLIFYANIVKINEFIFFPDGPVPVLSNFIAFLNLDFGFKTCFYEDMTPYAKVWLQYAFPVYIWVIIVVIIVLARYSVKLSKLVGSNALPVLVTLLVLSFTKLVRIIVLVFSISHLHFEDGSAKSVWTVDGNMRYSGPNHIGLLFVASVFLFMVLAPFTVTAILVPLRFHASILCPPCHKMQSKLSTRFPVCWLRLQLFSDALSGRCKDNTGYWVGLGLAARIVILVVVPFSHTQAILCTVFFIVLLFMFVFAVVGGVYKPQVNNVLEVWTLANVMVICILGLAGGVALHVSIIVSVSLMLLTFIAVLVLHIYWRLKKFNPFPRRIDYHPKENVVRHDAGQLQKEQNVAEMANSFMGTPGVQFREPLLKYVTD